MAQEATPAPMVARGIEAVELVTHVAQRARAEHPTRGVWEAADFQWWWRTPRPTDTIPQHFWHDDEGQPCAAAVLTDWGRRVAIDVIVCETAGPLAADAWTIGFAEARRIGKPLEVMIDDADHMHLERIRRNGFEDSGGRGASAWLDPPTAPRPRLLPDGYTMSSWAVRSARGHDHHLAGRNGGDVAARLRQTSLYRPDLDLVVEDDAGSVAAYGLFWHDPVTRVGFVEPLGTTAEHRRQGLARCLLTEGITRLLAAGSTSIKINYDRGHAPSRSLYLGLGFRPVVETSLFVRD